MSLVGIYPNGAPAITGPSTGSKKTDRIIKTSNHCILSVKLHVDLDVGNVEYIVSFFVILTAASRTVLYSWFYSSCSAVICRKRSAFEMKFYSSLKTCVRDHGDSFSRAM